MKAPDKIYLPVIASPLLHRDVIENHWMEVQSPFAKENIAYIRKDALIEWIQEARAIPHDNAIARDLAFQEVVNYLNSI